MSDNRYERITWRGRTFDRFTVAALKAAEYDLRRTLTIYQGSYNAGRVSQSAGTHDGGGAVDLWCDGITGRELARALRRVGFAAWYRPPRPGVWGAHVHAVQIGNARVSPSADRQVDEYLAGGDGLAGDYVDPDPWRPDRITFTYYEEPTVALLADLTAVVRKHRTTRIRAVRVLLRAMRETAGPIRRARINAALIALKEIGR